MHTLAGQQQVEAVGGSIVAADRGARLDRGDNQPVVDQFDLDDVGCGRERCIHCRFVATLEPIRQIARRFLPQQRRLRGERPPRIDHRRQRPVRHVDSLGGVARLLRRVGHDKRHRLANMSNPAARQRPARRRDHRRDRRHPGNARQRPDAVGVEIASGENAMHPEHRAGGRGIDAFYRRMPVGRAQHETVQLTGHSDVVDIAPLPGQKPRVFEAAQRTPDVISGHISAAGCRGLTRIRRHPRRGGERSSNSAGAG